MITMFFIITLIIISNYATAHPASNVDLKYDFDNQKLNITIFHNNDNVDTHYIKKVEVYKNGITIIEEDYTSQPSSNTFTLSFDVSADEGDVLKVQTECSISGKTEDSLTVKAVGNNTTKNEDTSTPGFEFLLIFIALSILLLVKKKKNKI